MIFRQIQISLNRLVLFKIFIAFQLSIWIFASHYFHWCITVSSCVSVHLLCVLKWRSSHIFFIILLVQGCLLQFVMPKYMPYKWRPFIFKVFKIKFSSFAFRKTSYFFNISVHFIFNIFQHIISNDFITLPSIFLSVQVSD